MKKFIMIFVLVLMSALLVSMTPSEVEKGYVTVKITNIENSKGVLEIGLYNDKDKFPEVGQTYRMVRVKINGKEVRYQFKNLKAGDYAICIYHDQNNDGECNKNLLGIPKEPYSFSNNFRPTFSKPSFSDCSFSLKTDKTITIKMVN